MLLAANQLRHAFVLVQISRFQQIIGVYTLQAPSDAAKVPYTPRSARNINSTISTCQQSFTMCVALLAHTVVLPECNRQ